MLTNSSHVTRDGTVHYQALKGGVFEAPDQKPWAHELSGRITSLVVDIVGEAEARVGEIRATYIQKKKSVPRKIRFAGVACATASELRAPTMPTITTDVVYSPLPEDAAHANFVTYQTISNEDLNPVRNWLKETLRVIKPQDINARITSCG